MLSAYLVKPGFIELRECPVPEPGKGEILLKIRSALTCGTDLKAYLRGHDLIPMPGPFGHEFSGVVVKKGQGVRKFRESDEIMSVHSAPCLHCRYCKKDHFNLCENIMASKVLGAFAEYILLPEHVVKQNAFRKPSGLSFDEAAMLEPLACVVHPYAMLDFSKISTAVVIGAGPIGLLHVTHLKMKGVHTIAADLNMLRLEAAGLSGADACCMPDALRDVVDRETSGMGVDLVVECTGQTDVWQESVLYTRRGGTVVLFGGCKSGTSATFDTHRLHYDEITLTGSFHFSPCDVKEAYRLLAGGTITVTPLISGVMNLTDIGTAFEKLKEGTGIKYAIRP